MPEGKLSSHLVNGLEPGTIVRLALPEGRVTAVEGTQLTLQFRLNNRLGPRSVIVGQHGFLPGCRGGGGSQLQITLAGDMPLPSFEGLEVTVDDVEVSDEDVQTQIESLRERLGDS